MRRAAMLTVVACAALGCDDGGETATQVVVTIDAEAGVRADTESLQIRVEGSSGRDAGDWTERFNEEHDVGPGAELSLPVEIALAPLDGDATRVYRIEGTALDDTGDTVGVVRAVSGYVPDEVRALRLVLEDCCRTVSCSAEQTCRSCECSDAFVPRDSLEAYEPDQELDGGAEDAGPPTDSGNIDGGVDDGGTDAATCPGFEEAPTGLCETNPITDSLSCGETDVLERDTNAVGLARDADTPATTVDGRAPSSCVCVSFEETSEEALVLRARSVQEACGDSCGSFCGSGKKVALFIGDGTALEDFQYVTTQPIREDRFETIVVPLDVSYRHALVCRDGSGHGRNNVEVEYVARTRCSTPTPPPGFVRIEPGAFTMGSPETEPGRAGDETQHEVTLTRAFYLQEREVTQPEWDDLMPTNPSEFSSCGGDCPVDSVNWWEAVTYANARSSSEGLAECYTLTGCTGTVGSDYECDGITVNAAGGNPYECEGYRLPTEAEFEYAYRAGTETALYNGGLTTLDCGVDPNLDAIAWYCGNSGGRPHAVKGKDPNPWGLYDISGNVWAWVWDWSAPYPAGPLTDPLGPDSGTHRMCRGGAWDFEARSARAANRCRLQPRLHNNNFGVRLARTSP